MQELNQASLDRSRLDSFLAAIRNGAASGAARIEKLSPLLARSLAIKFEASCLDKSPSQQAACLMQDQNALVLNDSHSRSITDALTGAPADLALQLSATPQAGLGYYSAYVGVVREVVRILGSFGTAQYQYIPALVTRRGDGMSLLLNATPSFTNPRSVLVSAMPAIENATPPPLRAASKAAICAAQPGLVLPVEGAPLVYATAYTHDMALRVRTRDGQTVELPATADPEKGGMTVDMKNFVAGSYDNAIDAVLHGIWGFDGFDGPGFKLQNAVGATWRLATGEDPSLVAGRDATIKLEGTAPSCIETMALRDAAGGTKPVKWAMDDAGIVTVTVPMVAAASGPVTLLIGQYGQSEPVAMTLNVVVEKSSVDGLSYHAGDAAAVLTGRRLDQVSSVRMGDIEFTPQDMSRVAGADQLAIAITDPQRIASLAVGATKTARIKFANGRSTDIDVTVAPSRPGFMLVEKTIAPAAVSAGLAIVLKNRDAVPVDSVLTFSIRATGTTRFTGHEVVDVVAGPGLASVQLTPAGGLVVRDEAIGVATLDPAKAFTRSAFGPLRFRIVQDGVPGEWQPLATLVRLPVIEAVKCADERGPCMLSATGLYLIDAVANNAALAGAVSVPEGITSNRLAVPHPRIGRLYLRLHDDPASVAEILAR